MNLARNLLCQRQHRKHIRGPSMTGCVYALTVQKSGFTNWGHNVRYWTFDWADTGYEVYGLADYSIEQFISGYTSFLES
jgi:hypothetical protein